MACEISLVRVLTVFIIGAGSLPRNHALSFSLRLASLHNHRRLSSYCSSWFRDPCTKHQQRLFYDDIIYSTIRSRNIILLHLSSPFHEQHRDYYSSTSPDESAISKATKDKQSQQSFSWPRLLELFRKDNTSPYGARNKMNFIPSDHPNLALFRRSAAAQKSYEEHKQYLTKYWKTPYDYMVIRKFGEDFGFTKAVVCRDDSLNDCSSLEYNGDIIIDQTGDENTFLHSCRVYQSSTSLTQASNYAIKQQLTYLSLVLNEFPYDVEEGIEHWCLWKIGGSSTTEGIVNDELDWAVREIAYLRSDDNSGSWCIYQRRRGNSTNDSTEKSLLDYADVLYSRQIGRTSQLIPIEDTLYWVNPPHLQSMPEICHAHILVLRSDKESDNVDA